MPAITRLGVTTAACQAALERYWAGGEILWVGNRSGLPSGSGESPDFPYSSLFGTGKALAALQATTNRGHVIFGLGGTAENVSAADMASDTGAANAFAFVGLGTGTAKPAYTWTAATSTWLIDTANIAFDNLQLFWAGPHAAGTAVTVAAPITVSATGFIMRKCDVWCGFDADQIITVGLTTTAAGDAMLIEDNRFVGLTAAEITAAGTVIRLVGSDDTIIRRNHIEAALATDTDGLIETLTTASLRIKIEDNFCYANGAGNTCALDFGADLVNTGFLSKNTLVVDADGTAQTVALTVHANCNFAGDPYNFMVSNNNERGLICLTATT